MNILYTNRMLFAWIGIRANISNPYEKLRDLLFLLIFLIILSFGVLVSCQFFWASISTDLVAALYTVMQIIPPVGIIFAIISVSVKRQSMFETFFQFQHLYDTSE